MSKVKMRESAYIVVRDLSLLQVALSALREVSGVINRDEDLIEAYKAIQVRVDQIYSQLDVHE